MGLNENTNGLVRQYFKKKTNFNKVSDSAVAKAIKMLNDRPRKLLAFKTPVFSMWEQMAALAA
jgi:IS30 family transposase